MMTTIAIHQFLHESRELWHWAYFNPSKLQARMNAWARPKEGATGDVEVKDILALRASGRFVAQFFLLVGLHTLPLLWLLVARGEGITVAGWLLVTALLGSYSVAYSYLPLGLPLPLLLAMVYGLQPTFFLQVGTALAPFLPSWGRLIGGGAIGYGGIVGAILLGWLLHQRGDSRLGYAVAIAGAASLPAIGVGVISASWVVAAGFGLGGGALLFFTLREEYEKQGTSEEAAIVAVVVSVVVAFSMAFSVAVAMAFSVAVVVAGGVALGVAGIVAGGVAVIVAGVVAVSVAGIVAGGMVGIMARVVTDIVADNAADAMVRVVAGAVAGGMASVVAVVVAGSVVVGVVFGVAGSVVFGVAFSVAGSTLLPLGWLLVFSAVVGLARAPVQTLRAGIGAALWLAPLGLENLGSLALLVVPATLAAYFHLPVYLYFFPISLAATFPLLPRRPAAHATLRRLPPHTTEILWLPLPGHARLLIDAFRADAPFAVETLQQMRAPLSPGLQRAAQAALPAIVAGQMEAVDSLAEIGATASQDHPYLPLLVPEFYAEEGPPPPADRSSAAGELAIMLPRLHAIARDVAVARHERGLEQCVDSLAHLQVQLLELGLKPEAIARWRPVIERWHRVIETARGAPPLIGAR